MSLSWQTYAPPDGDSYRQILVSPKSSKLRFYWTALKLQFGLKGVWKERVGETDTIYWDLRVGDATITLHLEHFLGITVFPTEGAKASDASVELLAQAYAVFE